MNSSKTHRTSDVVICGLFPFSWIVVTVFALFVHSATSRWFDIAMVSTLMLSVFVLPIYAIFHIALSGGRTSRSWLWAEGILAAIWLAGGISLLVDEYRNKVAVHQVPTQELIASRFKTTKISDQVVAFAVEEEITANHLEGRSDVCVALGTDLELSEGAIVATLEQIGFHVHENSWCNEGLRGMRIAVTSPVQRKADGSYEFTVELGDISPIQRGEHFAELIRRGDYVIQYDVTAGPRLVSYSRTCCGTKPN
jgi:hypothetical protein